MFFNGLGTLIPEGKKLNLKTAGKVTTPDHSQTRSQKNGVKTLQCDSKALKKEVDLRGSLDLVLILCPNVEISTPADELRVPKLSNAKGWKI